MILNAKKRIFWPGMKKDLHDFYGKCDECRMYRKSKANAKNEVSYEKTFLI